LTILFLSKINIVSIVYEVLDKKTKVSVKK